MNNKQIEKLLDMLDEESDALDELIVIRLSDLKELIEKKRLATIN